MLMILQWLEYIGSARILPFLPGTYWGRGINYRVRRLAEIHHGTVVLHQTGAVASTINHRKHK